MLARLGPAIFWGVMSVRLGLKLLASSFLLEVFGLELGA